MSAQSIIDQIPTMKPRQLMQLWKNAITHEAQGRNSKYYSTSKIVIKAIGTEWNRRKKSHSHHKALFIWPSTDAPGGDGRLTGQGWEQQGVLGFMGYSVGQQNGLSASIRRRLLTHVFEGPLPPVFSPVYLSQWGKPGSADRLRKMAESLAAFTRNAKRRSIQPTQAIRDWECDLEFLYEEFYVGTFGFEWPSTSVNSL